MVDITYHLVRLKAILTFYLFIVVSKLFEQFHISAQRRQRARSQIITSYESFRDIYLWKLWLVTLCNHRIFCSSTSLSTNMKLLIEL
jgi:hypothetical protein